MPPYFAPAGTGPRFTRKAYRYIYRNKCNNGSVLVMTPELDEAETYEIELDEHGRIKPFTRERAATLLRTCARSFPPSRFALYTVIEDPAESMMRILTIGGRDIRLLWIDEEPER